MTFYNHAALETNQPDASSRCDVKNTYAHCLQRSLVIKEHLYLNESNVSKVTSSRMECAYLLDKC